MSCCPVVTRKEWALTPAPVVARKEWALTPVVARKEWALTPSLLAGNGALTPSLLATLRVDPSAQRRHDAAGVALQSIGSVSL
jgi:hypothetical protein